MRSLAGIVLLSLAAWASGCVDSRFYQIPVNTPWPDEWVVGARNPKEEPIALAPATIRWHRTLDPKALAGLIDTTLGPKPGVRHYARMDFASAKGRSRRGAQTIPIVEVKIDATLLPARQAPAPVNETWTDKPFAEAVRSLADRFGRTLSVAPDVSLPATVSGELKNVDPRFAFAQVLLAHGLFFAPTVSAPQEIRSYEFKSRTEFLSALQAAARDIEQAASFDAPITIVSFTQWLRENPEPQRFIWQLAPGKDAAEPNHVSLALSTDPDLARKQLARTLHDRIK